MPPLAFHQVMKQCHGLALVATLLLPLVPVLADGTAEPPARPNFLFILVDDQSPFDFKFYNPRSPLQSPNLDRLAADGMVFDGAYHMGAFVGAVCTPSRHMIMSGRTLWHLPIGPGGARHCPPNLETNTLAAVFNRAGYETMRTCKVGNSYEGANRQFAIRHDATQRGGTDESGSAWHAEQVLNYLHDRKTANDTKPFLIYFGFSHPHDTRDGKPDLLAHYGAVNHADPAALPPSHPDQPRLPVNYLPAHPFPHGHPNLRDEVAVSGVWTNRDERTIRNELGRELACAENIDFQIGRVLAELEAMGERENTYVFYTADHGMAIGRHGLQGKQNLYQHTWRVPFIAQGPGIRPGSRVEGNIYLLDVLATLCDLAEIPPPAPNEGISFRPVLEGQEPTIRDTLYGVYSGGTTPGMRCVKQGDWKLIQYDVLEGRTRVTQLFNLKDNPEELLAEHGDPDVVALTGLAPTAQQRNLAGDPAHAGKLAELQALLLAEMRRLDDPYRLGDQPDDFATRETDQTGSPGSPHERRSLKHAVGDRFRLGVGVGDLVLQNPDDAALIRQHFRILTPENCMKPQSIHPGEDQWRFEAADRFVDFARSNQLEVVGHCLVWAKDDRTAEWMMQEDGAPVSRQTLLRRIEAHINTVVERYADVATTWDVVNEAIGDGDEGLLRDSVYSRTTGLDFIVTAFQAARARDPEALLVYNDYNGHKPGKREKLIELLTQLKQRGAPVDAYGMQGHFELGDNSIPELRETFDALRKLDLKVVVSELDIDVVTRSRWWAEGGKYRDELAAFDPYQDGLPAAVEQQQLEQYVALFRLFDEYRDILERVSFWNLHDGQSWLNYFPWHRVNYPLLFDRDRKPKPVFDAVYAALQTPTAGHLPVERRDENSRMAHQQLIQKTKQGRIDVYFQGDSITRRWGATDYPSLLSHWRKHFHGWNAANFAWGGDTTQNILWRMQNGELDAVTPKVVVLQAGANNLPWLGPADDAKVDEVYLGIRAILDEFGQRFPEATIILTAMFPRTQNPELAPTIHRINERLETLGAGDRIRFLNLNDQLTDSTGRLRPGFSSDGLHFEEPAYEVWAGALTPILKEVLGPRADQDQAPPPTGDPRAAR